MGSKADAVTNKNMLSQVAMSKSYLNAADTWQINGVGITTWQPNSNDLWHKHKTFIWEGEVDDNGLYVNYSGDDDNFNWSVNASNQPEQWKQVSEITQYDDYSLPLEVRDINGNYAGTKTGDHQTKTIATANASLSEMHYSGAEYLSGVNFDNGISGIGRTSVKAHTGEYAIEISTQQGFRTLVNGHRAGAYKISVWAAKENYENA